MKKSNPYGRAILFAVLTAATVVAGGIVVYNLTKQSLKVAKEIELNTKAADAYEQRLSDLDELKENYQALQIVEPEANSLISDAVPSNLGYPRYIIALKNIAQSSTGYNSLTLSESTTLAAGQNYSAASVSMDFVSSWERLLNFLDSIQHGTRITDVSNIQIQGKGALTATMRVDIYYQDSKSTEER